MVKGQRLAVIDHWPALICSAAGMKHNFSPYNYNFSFIPEWKQKIPLIQKIIFIKINMVTNSSRDETSHIIVKISIQRTKLKFHPGMKNHHLISPLDSSFISLKFVSMEIWVIFQGSNEKNIYFMYIFGNKTILGTILRFLLLLATSSIFSTTYIWKTKFFKNFVVFSYF